MPFSNESLRSTYFFATAKKSRQKRPRGDPLLTNRTIELGARLSFATKFLASFILKIKMAKKKPD